MEEACTHWSRKVAVRCFVCTTVAVCTVGLLNPKRVLFLDRSIQGVWGMVASLSWHLPWPAQPQVLQWQGVSYVLVHSPAACCTSKECKCSLIND